jgi:stearoyl-CoA desaturase (delta-9 desaturase)
MELRVRQRAESLRAFKIRATIVHLACFGVFFVPFTPELLIAATLGFFIRVFSWEIGSHRYFSHRSFKTSRAFQFVLAVLAAASGQRGVLWWAEHHRRHHRHADRHPDDLHSPVLHSLWQAHFGWLLSQDALDTDLESVRDLTRFPELVWINKYHYFFPLALLILTFVVGQYTALFGRSGLGLAAVVWVFFVSMVLSQQSAFSLNTAMHGVKPGWFNSRRYPTPDSTTNMWLLAIPTLGAAWHNNHHRYMNSARTGFYWYELDLGYVILRVLGLVRIVWDLHPVPDEVLAEGRSGAVAPS